MPDVDAEWAQFEREVIGKNTKPNLLRVAAWAGGIGIAATIALLFMLNMGSEESADQPMIAQQVKEQPAGTQQRSENPLPVIREDSQAIMHLAGVGPKSEYIPSPIDSDFQERVARLEIVPTSADLGSVYIMRLASNAQENEPAPNMQGRIAGLNLDDNPIRFVTKIDRSSRPYIWERDTVLALVNGKEDSDFVRYLNSLPHWSMSYIYDYFFERNQLYLKQSILSKEELKTQYDASLFEGRDIRLVIDYLTKPFTHVSQLTPEQIKSRRLAYLLNKYRKGFNKNSAQDYFSPDLYDTPAEERLFGLTAAKCRRYGQQHEYFGPMGSDSHGIYTPLIRDVVMTTHDDAWWENGEVWVLKDDPHFNQIVDDIRQAATRAESSAVTIGDSIVRLAFIFGGKVIEGQQNDLLSGMQKKLYEQVKKSSFAFKPDEDALTWWWGEAYYSTTSQRQLWMHLHSVDKLYATDCPELLSNRRHIEGTVTDEKGEPLAEASVGIGFVTPWDAVTTDSQGHFDLWMPFRDATIHVNHVGYIPKQIQPADTILNFRMKDATKIKDVKVIPKRGTVSSGSAPSGIDAFTTDMQDGKYYDLQGHGIDGVPTEPGIYIVNGKKVMIK